MTPKKSLLWIVELETRIKDVDDRYYSIDFWPVIRTALLGIMVSDPRGTSRKIVKKKKSLLCFLGSLVSLLTAKQYDNFILTNSKYSTIVDREKYLKDSYALNEILDSKNMSLLTGLLNDKVDESIFSKNRIVSVYSLIVVSSLASKLPFIVRLFPKISSYVDLVESHLVESEVCEKSANVRIQLIRNLVFCVISSYLYSIFLSKVAPKNCFIQCYYSVTGMAFCAACRKVGVPIADIQHGMSGRNMRAYAQWSICPEGGYLTLPSEFLTWTTYDANAINDWASDSDGAHKALAVGNLWRNYFIDSELYNNSKKEWANFIGSIASFDCRIVITMQSDVFHPLLLKMIESFEDKYCFLIRCHPDFSAEDFRMRYEALSKKINVFFEEPTRMPISILMSISNINITEWSASVYDALFEGVRSIVITEHGSDYYEDYIDLAYVKYASNIEQMTSAVEDVEFYNKNIEVADLYNEKII